MPVRRTVTSPSTRSAKLRMLARPEPGTDTTTVGWMLADAALAMIGSLSGPGAAAARTLPGVRASAEGPVAPGELVAWCRREQDPGTLWRLSQRDDLPEDAVTALMGKVPAFALTRALAGDPGAATAVTSMSKSLLRAHVLGVIVEADAPAGLVAHLARKLDVAQLNVLAGAARRDEAVAGIVAQRIGGLHLPSEASARTRMHRSVDVLRLAGADWPEPVRAALRGWIVRHGLVAPLRDDRPDERGVAETIACIWGLGPLGAEVHESLVRAGAAACRVASLALDLCDRVGPTFSGPELTVAALADAPGAKAPFPFAWALRAGTIFALRDGRTADAGAWARAAVLSETRPGRVMGISARELGNVAWDALDEATATALVPSLAHDALTDLVAAIVPTTYDFAHALAEAGCPAVLERIPVALRHEVLADRGVALRHLDAGVLALDDILACPVGDVLATVRSPEVLEAILALLDYRADALSVLGTFPGDHRGSVLQACAAALAAVR